MRKQEIIHVHGLLAEISSYYGEKENHSMDLDEYRELGVRPTSIYKSKTDHKEAVFTLSEAIVEELEDGDEDISSRLED